MTSTRIGAPVASEAQGATAALAEFIEQLTLADIPSEVVARGKYLILDGIACGLLGARLPWSDRAVQAIGRLEGDGNALIWGWQQRVPAPAAALLNGTFVQGFELDDYHPLGPLHSEACVIPAVVASAEQMGDVSGRRLLESILLGFEVGPRIGMAMGGLALVARGWHCGSIYGAIASAAACSKLRGLDRLESEDALGIAATQACGLMSAQFEAMVKRMHSGFAARSGVYAAALAEAGFTGIKRVIERDYGGFATTFAGGDPVYLERLTDALGDRWEILRIAVKPPYACMGGLHAAIDAVLELRRQAHFAIERIARIEVGLARAMYKHAGWRLERPAEVIGAQMNVAYAIAVSMLDGDAFVPQFTPDRLSQDDVWRMMDRVIVSWDESLDSLGERSRWATRLAVHFTDGTVERIEVTFPLGSSERPLSNEDIGRKAQRLMALVCDDRRADEIRDLVLNLEALDSVADLTALLAPSVRPAF